MGTSNGENNLIWRNKTEYGTKMEEAAPCPTTGILFTIHHPEQ
jgi:hypothetical protein